MPQVACESKLPSRVRSSIHPCPGNWVAIERPVVYNAQAAQVFRAGIKCRQSIAREINFRHWTWIHCILLVHVSGC